MSGGSSERGTAGRGGTQRTRLGPANSLSAVRVRTTLVLRGQRGRQAVVKDVGVHRPPNDGQAAAEDGAPTTARRRHLAAAGKRKMHNPATCRAVLAVTWRRPAAGCLASSGAGRRTSASSSRRVRGRSIPFATTTPTATTPHHHPHLRHRRPCNCHRHPHLPPPSPGAQRQGGGSAAAAGTDAAAGTAAARHGAVRLRERHAQRGTSAATACWRLPDPRGRLHGHRPAAGARGLLRLAEGAAARAQDRRCRQPRPDARPRLV